MSDLEFLNLFSGCCVLIDGSLLLGIDAGLVSLHSEFKTPCEYQAVIFIFYFIFLCM